MKLCGDCDFGKPVQAGVVYCPEWKHNRFEEAQACPLFMARGRLP